MESAVVDRVAQIQDRIRALRPEEGVRIMAVTKGQPLEAALAAASAGLTIFGENWVQEAREKWTEHPPEIELHLIGHLQTNKVKFTKALFDAIDSIDSERIAQKLSDLHAAAAHPLPVMVEVNAGREAQKTGWWPEQVRDFLAGQAQPGLRYVGMMVILPRPNDASRQETQRIRDLMQETGKLWRMCRSEGWPWAPLDELSMGMSGDYEWAVEAGATMVRLGEAIFGPRIPRPRRPST